MSDEQRIRELIQRWAAAVHTGDLDAVLTDHATDIVMFDVPPPEQGVRGLDAYRDTWPEFLAWQATGAFFEIDSLDVTAGDDVGFAAALLRCGTVSSFERRPDQRLRLTIGLRKITGRWIVTHEHHSFTAPVEVPPGTASAAVTAIFQQWFERTAARDLEGLMEHIADDIVSFEHAGAMQYVGIDDVRAVCQRGLQSAGDIEFDIPDLTVRVSGDLAVAWGIDRVVADGTESLSRGTRIFQCRDETWQLIHQHLSVPVKPAEATTTTG
jgi:uncharacterized protein (TIGR02246 family)